MTVVCSTTLAGSCWEAATTTGLNHLGLVDLLDMADHPDLAHRLNFQVGLELAALEAGSDLGVCSGLGACSGLAVRPVLGVCSGPAPNPSVRLLRCPVACWWCWAQDCGQPQWHHF